MHQNSSLFLLRAAHPTKLTSHLLLLPQNWLLSLTANANWERCVLQLMRLLHTTAPALTCYRASVLAIEIQRHRFAGVIETPRALLKITSTQQTQTYQLCHVNIFSFNTYRVKWKHSITNAFCSIDIPEDNRTWLKHTYGCTISMAIKPNRVFLGTCPLWGEFLSKIYWRDQNT